jgi:hypothetical protein
MISNRTITLFLLTFLTHLAKGQIDTTYNEIDSLNRVINREINRSLNSRPPVIAIDLFANSIKVSNKYVVHLVVNGKSIMKTKGGNIKLNLHSFNNHDSVSFLLTYGMDSILTNKFTYKWFIHGGNLIFGIVYDYLNERKKYLNDSDSYLQDNQKNYLYEILSKTTKNEEAFFRKTLLYSVIKSNTSEKINFKWKFR